MATIEQLILQMKVEGKQNVDSLNDSVKRVGSSINDLKSDIAGMAQVGGPLSTTLNGIIGRLGPLGIAASLAGAAFVGLGSKALQMAGDLSDISGATGIAAGTLKNFKDSVIEAGGSADDFAQLAAKLNQSVQEAAGGNEQFQKAFRELGVYVTDTSGRVRSTESILRDLTERFQQGELTSKQYSSAIDILGRNINKLELQKLKALANPELDADIKRLDRYNEQIDKLRSLLEKQIITFFGKVAEDINKGIDAIDKYYDKLEEKEKELNARGKTSRAFTPDDLMSQAPGTGIPYRLGGRAMTDAEKAILKRKEFEAEMERLNRPYQPRPNEREDTGGGFGAEPESIKKAREEAQKYVLTQRQGLQSKLDSVGANLDQLELEKKLLGLSREQAAALREQTKAEDQFNNILRDLGRQKEQLELELKLIPEDEPARAEIVRGKLGEINNQIAEVTKKSKEIPPILAEQARINEGIRVNRERERAAIEEILILQDELNKGLADNADKIRISANAYYDQLNNLTEVNKYEEQRLAFERSIANLSPTMQANMRRILDLEQQRQRISESISNDPNLNDEQRSVILQRLNTQTDQYIKNITDRIALDKQEQDSFVTGWRTALNRWRNNVDTNFQAAEKLFARTINGLEDLFVKFARTGKFEWKQFVNDLGEQLLRSQLQQTFKSIFGVVGDSLSSGEGFMGKLGSLLGLGGAGKGSSPTNPLFVVDATRGGSSAANQGGGLIDTIIGGVKSIGSSLWNGVKSIGSSILGSLGFGGGGGGGSSILGSIVKGIGSLFGGFFATGGTLGRGRWGIAGENGPELISGPATITPMGASTTVVYNIQAVDALSFQQLVARDPSFIHAVAMQGAKGMARR